MTGLASVKRRVSGYREIQSIRTHRTRMMRRSALAYTRYLKRAQQAFCGPLTSSAEVERAVREFEQKGCTSFWDQENQGLAGSIFSKIRQEEERGQALWNTDLRYNKELFTAFPEIEQLFRGSLGSFLMGVYRAYFKIFYGILYRSERVGEEPTGSQLWHDDGGPGTCIIVMFYLKDVTKEDGAMECVPWEASRAIYEKSVLSGLVQQRLDAIKASGRALSREEARAVRCEYYREEIARSYQALVEQPTGRAGLLLPFRNNIIHKGGYPQPGQTRYVCVFHCYPSDKPTPFERYRLAGIPKRGSLPRDPAEDF